VSHADWQTLLADTSSAAVLGLMLRVLSSPDIVMGGPELADRLVVYALQWTMHGSNSVDSSTADTSLDEVRSEGQKLFYAMAGDRAASYFLETVMECCQTPLLIDLLRSNVVGHVEEYANDMAGNFVLQAMLRRLSSQVLSEIEQVSQILQSSLVGKKKSKRTKSEESEEVEERRCP
jgi:hypothetical protein